MVEASDTRTKLIEAAIDLFSAGGFKGTSIRDIAKATDMTISNIYYYFGSKDGLFLAILEHSTKDLVETLRQVTQVELEPSERLKLLIRAHLGLVKVHKKEAKVFFLDEEHLSPEGNRINKKYQMEILDIYRALLADLQASHCIGYQNLTVLALNILGVINWHLRWYRPDGPLSLDQVMDDIITFILHGALFCPAQDTQSQPLRPPQREET